MCNGNELQITISLGCPGLFRLEHHSGSIHVDESVEQVITFYHEMGGLTGVSQE